MQFHPTKVAGACVIDLERYEDERGFFARSFCSAEFAREGLVDRFVQCNVSFNRRAGTMRGMHYQATPHEEAKLVRCTCGAIFDAIADIRPGSATYGQWDGCELDATGRRMLYVPPGVAHGFLTLVDDTEVFYEMGAAYVPEAARGFHHADPTFAIAWPRPVAVISDRDRDLAPFEARS